MIHWYLGYNETCLNNHSQYDSQTHEAQRIISGSNPTTFLVVCSSMNTNDAPQKSIHKR